MKAKKMLVWNDNDVSQNKVERYVAHIFNNGSCYAVAPDDEEEFEHPVRSKNINLYMYDHCEEIPEQSYRPYGANDNIEALLGVTIKSKKKYGNAIHIITGVSSTSGLSIHGDWWDWETVFREWETIVGLPLGVKVV